MADEDMSSNELEGLWLDLIDGINEIREDFKGNRRGLRHLRSLEITVKQIDIALRQMAAKGSKKGFLR
jgi:hypothetical protein